MPLGKTPSTSTSTAAGCIVANELHEGDQPPLRLGGQPRVGTNAFLGVEAERGLASQQEVCGRPQPSADPHEEFERRRRGAALNPTDVLMRDAELLGELRLRQSQLLPAHPDPVAHVHGYYAFSRLRT